ncbi:hypothetical protein F4860DRAFT_485683 [Xylaria cubensis]|nr:hypothetical protein F4860DRAFT_485683 [Xylaria cubensis]
MRWTSEALFHGMCLLVTLPRTPHRCQPLTMARDPRTLNLHMKETVHCMEVCACPLAFKNPFVSNSADLNSSIVPYRISHRRMICV